MLSAEIPYPSCHAPWFNKHGPPHGRNLSQHLLFSALSMAALLEGLRGAGHRPLLTEKLL